MDVIQKQSREVQVVVGGALLFLLFSFFDWQHFDVGFASGGFSMWRGIGVLTGLVAVALLAWEAVRLFEVKLDIGGIKPGLISVALALLLLVLTVITFLSHNEGRHWPAWLGLLLSIAIAIAAFMRAKTEGVDLSDIPDMPRSTSGGSSTPSEPAAPSTPAAPPAAPGDQDPPRV